MTSLLDSIRLGDLVLPNRIAMAPVTRSRSGRDGVPTVDNAAYYAQRACCKPMARWRTASTAASQPRPPAP